jgi:hypothetical protein
LGFRRLSWRRPRQFCSARRDRKPEVHYGVFSKGNGSGVGWLALIANENIILLLIVFSGF